MRSTAWHGQCTGSGPGGGCGKHFASPPEWLTWLQSKNPEHVEWDMLEACASGVMRDYLCLECAAGPEYAQGEAITATEHWVGSILDHDTGKVERTVSLPSSQSAFAWLLIQHDTATRAWAQHAGDFPSTPYIGEHLLAFICGSRRYMVFRETSL